MANKATRGCIVETPIQHLATTLVFTRPPLYDANRETVQPIEEDCMQGRHCQALAHQQPRAHHREK